MNDDYKAVFGVAPAYHHRYLCALRDSALRQYTPPGSRPPNRRERRAEKARARR